MRPVETALDLALIVIENGGSTPAADRTFRNVLKNGGPEGVSVSWRLDMVTVGYKEEGRPVTVLRPVGVVGTNLARVSEAVVLGERAARGEVDPAALAGEVERVRTVAVPYGLWARTAAAAGVASLFCRLFGGDWGACGVVFAAAAIGQFVRASLAAKRFAIAPLTLVCAVISTCLAAVGMKLGFSHTPQAALISSAFYMVPGPPLINGFVDMLSHRFLMIGLQRTANAAFLCLLMAVAIAFAYAVVL